MTPLAHRIVKELCLPIKDRTVIDNGGLLKEMADVHCFECSKVLPLAMQLAEQIPDYGIDERSTFLPAPRTWIEYVPAQITEPQIKRIGFLLIEIPRSKRVRFILAAKCEDGSWESIERRRYIDLSYERSDVSENQVDEVTLALLAIINTPRIVGRTQHMPHRGLEKRLMAEKKVIGSFPLHAWTEIHLSVTGPSDVSDENSHEAHYTGKVCLHFCRAHLRVRLGRLEFVKAHWRGDGALGIKRSRYIMDLPSPSF